MSNRPMIDAFVQTWKQYLQETGKPEYLKYTNNCDDEDGDEIYSEYADFATAYIHEYVATTLSLNTEKENIINEFGMKKLIDLMCEYNGDEICDDLLNFSSHIAHWTETLLGRVIKVY